MQEVYQVCCGLDVHKRTVVACLIKTDSQGKPQKELRTFGTITHDLLQLADWLADNQCEHAVMESTGVYWKPVYNILSGHCEVMIVNAQHLKAVPGRKTDVQDAEWLADLLQHGLLRASFIPSAEQQEWRELTRYRRSLVEERVRIVNRIRKTLEDTNIKLGNVVSRIDGISARLILEAMLSGQTDPRTLAELARGRLRAKRTELEAALHGKLKTHHVFLLTEYLAHLDYLDEALSHVNQQLEQRLQHLQASLELLDTIPGINRAIAQVVLAEVGHDLSRFPSAKHLASWAGLCPGNNESAGKQRSGRTRRGNRALRQTLLEAAHGAVRTKGSYFMAQFHRLAPRRGKKRAMIAVAHSLLVVIYHLLTKHEPYRDLGMNYFDERDATVLQRRLVRRLEKLGFQVQLAPVPALA
jgi:transposase